MEGMSKRIVFMGTPDFAVASLDALVRSGIEVAAVVTAPDKPAGRGQQMRMSAVKEFALSLGLPVLQPAKLRDPVFNAALDRAAASLYVVVAFRMLPAEVWNRPEAGTINLHGSLLPAYRGAAPINWAIINGETRTGATTFFIRQEIDTGDLLDRAETEIGPDETAGELHDRLKELGADLLVKTVQRVLSGDRSSTPQAVGAGGWPIAPKLTTEGCRILWSLPAKRVHDFIRGLSPFPGAWSVLVRSDGSRLKFKVLRASIHEAGTHAEPGSVQIIGYRMLVACNPGWLRALEVQPEGKRRMAAEEFLRGAPDLAQARLE